MSTLSWAGIVRLGLVQTALGAVVVLTTSTINRVMVVELALPAFVPGLLVALHYIIQALRPLLGYGSDIGGRRIPWIIGGMLLLASGGIAAAFATAWMETSFFPGVALAIVAFMAIGLGVGAAGTSLLALLAQRVSPERRAPAATIVWLMMIGGIALTAGIGGKMLDPFSTTRLVEVAIGVGCIAVLMTIFAVWGTDDTSSATKSIRTVPETQKFSTALREIWDEPASRRFALFVFASMLAYSAQELVLEPFAGAVFGLTPGESAGLAGLQHTGVLLGMIVVAILGRRAGLRSCTIAGCTLSAVAILVLSGVGLAGPDAPLRSCVFVLGAANGAFAASAIGAMMGLAHQGTHGRAGTRMGLWGAAQAIAFGAGGIAGTGLSDLARLVFSNPGEAYALVFAVEAGLFLFAALLAGRVFNMRPVHTPLTGVA